MAIKKSPVHEIALYEKRPTTTNNYFTCGRQPFFFNDRSVDSTHQAFDAAMEFRAAIGGRARVTVYRRLAQRGPWEGVAGPVEE